MRITLFFIFLLFDIIAVAQPVIAVKQGQGYRYVDSKTKSPVSDLTWDEAEPFVNGFARVLQHDKFTFVNHQGIAIAAVQFDAARNFCNKLSAVRKDGKWGFIDESGKMIIPFQYEIAFDFKETITVVSKNNKWFLINKKGIIIKSLDITVCYGFNKGYAKVEKNGRKGIMDLMGEITFNREEPNIYNPSAPSPVPVTVNGSSDCPDNIDFEYGSFFNWKCFTGRVDSLGNTNVITVNPSAPTPNRHTLYSRLLPSPLDAYGLFPVNPPDGSNFAVRLGNTEIGAQAERIQYKIRVPANDSNFSIKYDYAVVFEDPGHTTWSQPRFTARLFDSAANAYVDCASFEYISTSNLPGFAHSTLDTAVIYKPWSSVFVSLRGYAGKTMLLEFTTADCVRRGHWGYAYVDVEKPCGQSVQVQYDCTSPNITNLSGPPGFQTYNWWDSSYTNLLATGQQVILNPGPPANSTVWLEMIPFNDFGCRDSMPVKITGVFNADFGLSDTAAVCAPHSFTFYNRSLPSTSATWDFGDGNTGSGDTVTHIYALPGNYIVTLNVVLPGGCAGSVKKTVSILQPVGNFYFNGAYFCNRQQVRFDAVVSNADTLFWNFGDGMFATSTQTTVYHNYASPGVYLPYLTVQSNFGCRNTVPSSDTIRIEKLRAAYFHTVQKSCGSSVINLTDNSYAFFGINDHQWDFGDGTTGTGSMISHTYTATGTYNIQLIITGISGCKDTVLNPVYIEVYNKPAASITGLNIQCQDVPVTFDANIQSVDAVNLVEWTSSNGNNGTGNNFTVTFPQPGNYSIQLITGTVHNCFDTANYPITINPIISVSQPADQSLCNGNLTTLIHFTGPVNTATYNWTNNNPQIGLAAMGSGDISSFTATNNTAAPVTAIITVNPAASGCPGSPKTFTIVVDPTAMVDQLSNQLLCKNEPTSGITFTGPVNGTTYTWANDNTMIGLPASGSGNIPSFTAINNTTLPLTATITVTPVANGCPGVPKLFTIIVNPMPAVTTPPDQQFCNGTVTPIIYFATAVNGAGFSWTNDNPSIGLPASGSGNIPSFTAVNASNSDIIATITVSASANVCPGPPKSFTITVKPTATILQPSDQILCNGASTNAIAFTGAVNGATYTWSNDNPGIGLAATGFGDVPAFTAINNSNIPDTANIIVKPVANGCPGIPATFTFIVKPTASVNQLPDLILCNSAPTSIINFNSSVQGTTFTWTNSNTAIGLAAAGSGNIASFTSTNSGTTPEQATVTVTPSSNGCAGISKTFIITVNPTPNFLQPGSQVLCNGANTSAVSFSATVNGTRFDWVNSHPSIGLDSIGTGNIGAFPAQNNSSSPIIATITVTPTALTCPGTPKAFTITINPSPVITQLSDQSLCNGATTTPIALSSTTNATVYTWTNNNSSVGLAANGTGNISSFVAVNNSSTTITAVITVSGTAYGCTGRVKTTKIIIHPTPTITAGNDRNVCLGKTVQLSATGAAQYSWSPADSLSCANCSNPIITPKDNIQFTVQGTSSFGCIGYDSVLLRVIRPFDMLVDPGDTLCAGRSTGLKAMHANSYIWSPSAGLNNTNIAAPTATPSTTTNYQVIGYDAYNCFTDTGHVLITVGPRPAVNIGADITTTTGAVVTLHPNIQNGPIINYLWTPATYLSCTDCANPVATIKNNIEYTVTVTNIYGCTATDMLRVNAFCQSGQVFIPNSFTPDGDGLNDIFMIRGTGIMVKTFRIFNRWGELVFERKNFNPNDPSNAWDGRVRGVPASPDVFVYTADVICDNNVVYTYKGNTTILK